MAKVTDRLRRFVAVRELRAAEFHVHGVARADRRWARVTSPGNDHGVMFRVGSGKWHWFAWEHAWTGSSHRPERALCGGLGDVVDTDAQLRSYMRQIDDAPQCYAFKCAGLRAARDQVFSERGGSNYVVSCRRPY